MRNFLKRLLLCCIPAFVFWGCQSSNNNNGGTTTPGTCRIDKIQSYGIISTTTPEDFYFFYDASNALTQINGVTTTNTDISRAKFVYNGSILSRIETYSLSAGTLQMDGYIDYTYSGSNISVARIYQKSGTTFPLSITHEYTYDGNGNRTKKVIKTGTSAQLLVTDTYTYDSQGNIIKMEDRNASNQLQVTYNFEYNNKLNPFPGYNKNIDQFGWVFFDGNGYFYQSAFTDARFFSKYQMVKQIQAFATAPAVTYNYSYTYDGSDKISMIESNAGINRAVITYKCN